MIETWAEATFQPSGVRIQVWLWRPILSEPSRWNSTLAMAKSAPKVVISVRRRVRGGEPPTRPTRKAAISSSPRGSR
jgi:hypothetical protein